MVIGVLRVLRRRTENADLSFDDRDSAPFMPKCVVVDPNFDWHGKPRAKGLPWDNTIIYEAHVKGFTKLHPSVPDHLRGTYGGLGVKEVIDYIKSLGVTAIELLPVHTFVDDSHLLERGLKNYWGYNSIGFFAPDPRYASAPDQCLREFKEMVARFHDAGLEVILDVVYNHTAEGNELGPDLVVQGDRQRQLLPIAARAQVLHQRHRHRQYVESVEPGGHRDGHRQFALLGQRTARRWFSIRSRHDLGARAQRLRQSERISQSLQSGSGAAYRQADRRAVGLRPGRVSGGWVSSRLGRVE